MRELFEQKLIEFDLIISRYESGADHALLFQELADYVKVGGALLVSSGTSPPPQKFSPLKRSLYRTPLGRAPASPLGAVRTRFKPKGHESATPPRHRPTCRRWPPRKEPDWGPLVPSVVTLATERGTPSGSAPTTSRWWCSTRVARPGSGALSDHRVCGNRASTRRAAAELVRESRTG